MGAVGTPCIVTAAKPVRGTSSFLHASLSVVTAITESGAHQGINYTLSELGGQQSVPANTRDCRHARGAWRRVRSEIWVASIVRE